MRTNDNLNNPLEVLSALQTGSQTAGSITATVGDVVSSAANFLSTCKGNCWSLYPPFSGKGKERGNCFTDCQRRANTNTQSNNISKTKNAALPLIGAAFLAYALLNKKK